MKELAKSSQKLDKLIRREILNLERFHNQDCLVVSPLTGYEESNGQAT